MSEYEIDMMNDPAEIAAFQAEMFYFNTIDVMSDLIVAYGRNRVMADVTEAVIKKLSEIEGEL
jgi:hypothetical protein